MFFILLGWFFDYKVQHNDDIASHLQNINEMVMLLKDLDQDISQKMILSKIICNLLASFNPIVAAWSNVPESS